MSRQVLLLDQGNTRLKFRLLSPGGDIIREGFVMNEQAGSLQWISGLDPGWVMSLNSGALVFDPPKVWPEAVCYSFLPSDGAGISWAYEDVNQLGRDRMAAMLGASTDFPNANLILADAGTCLTVDFLAAGGRHLGGFISPGFSMRLQAMHSFTHSLPLTEAVFAKAPGKSTIQCMQAGAFCGILAELDFHLQCAAFGNNAPVVRILSGGDAKDLAHHLKESTFVAEDLIFKGLYRAWKGRI
jgi:type III pantothenate kinase